MWRKTKKLSALKLDTKEEIVSVETVRRTEVTVEREVCSLTVHGSLILTEQESCPLCGQRLTAGESSTPDTSTELNNRLPNNKGN